MTANNRSDIEDDDRSDLSTLNCGFTPRCRPDRGEFHAGNFPIFDPTDRYDIPVAPSRKSCAPDPNRRTLVPLRARTCNIHPEKIDPR